MRNNGKAKRVTSERAKTVKASSSIKKEREM